MQTLYNSVFHKISKEMSAQNKTQKQLTDFLNVSKSTFTDWKSGKSQSFRKYLPQIAEFLDVSVDYLVGNNQTESSLSESQQKLYDSVSNLPDDDISKVIEYIELLKLKNKNDK